MKVSYKFLEDIFIGHVVIFKDEIHLNNILDYTFNTDEVKLFQKAFDENKIEVITEKG